MSIEFYNQNAQNFFERTIGAEMGDTRSRFLKYVVIGGHILDAGCGSGRDSLAFLQNGYQVTSMDASIEMVRMSIALTAAVGGKPTSLRKFQEIDEEDCYDGIWASASLLHVAIDEMSDVLQRLFSALKSGGVFYCSFKYGEGLMEREGRQFTMFTENTLDRFVHENTAFQKVELWVTNDVRPEKADEKWVNGLWVKV